MKTSNFIVRIPEPCHEDWNKMKPDSKGKFCHSCSKSVFDFSTKTDAEIKDILLEYKDQKVCGHFKKSQINRPLNIRINLFDLPKNISTTKAFAIALFLVFGTFLFSCTDEHGQKVDKIEVVETVTEQPQYSIGMMAVDIPPPPPIDSAKREGTMMTGETVIMINEEHIDGGISIEEVTTEDVPVMDSVYLEEVTIVDYLEPLIDSETLSGSVSVTTGLVSYYVVQPDSVVEDANKTTNKQSELTIYPNPSNGEFTVKYQIKKRTNSIIEIYDLKGILIKTIVNVTNQHEGNYQIPVSLNEMPNGIYLVSLINGDEKFVERVVIER